MKSVFALAIVLSVFGLAIWGVCHGVSSAYHWVKDTHAPQRAVDAAGRGLDQAASATDPRKGEIAKWIKDHD